MYQSKEYLNRLLQLIWAILFIVYPKVLCAQFIERSAENGIDHEFLGQEYIGGGVAIFNLNGDNLPDLYFTGGSRPDQLYVNNGNGFDRVVTYLAPEDFEYYEYITHGVAAGDINNDGYDDLYVTTVRYYPDLLLVNNGDNTFDAIPAESSGIGHVGYYVSAAMGDLDNDGWLDITAGGYVDEISSYDSSGTTVFTHTAFRNRLYRNNRDGTFTDVSVGYSIDTSGTTLAVSFTDYDNDHDADLYVVNDFGHFIHPNELYRNDGGAPFTDVSESSGADIGLFGMGLAIGDYDNDLDIDYYVTNIGRNSLLKNNLDGSFTDVTNEAGVQDSSRYDDSLKVGWGTGFFDYDNDGDLDLYISNGHIPSGRDIGNPLHNPNAFYRNQGTERFEDVSQASGIDLDAICRGSAYGDLDGDGDVDLIFVPSNTSGVNPPGLRRKAAVFYNEGPGTHHWVAVKTVGTVSNRNGYGAHVYLYDAAGNVQMREVDGGSSHASSNWSVCHFGLGSVGSVDSVIIRWPSGSVQRLYNITADRLNIAVEGSDVVVLSPGGGEVRKLRAYPNPARGRLTVETGLEYLPEGTVWQLLDPGGKLVRSASVKSDIFEVDMTSLPVGAYGLVIDVHGRTVASGTVIKK